MVDRRQYLYPGRLARRNLHWMDWLTSAMRLLQFDTNILFQATGRKEPSREMNMEKVFFWPERVETTMSKSKKLEQSKEI
jgi:hypothetical protein